MKRQGDLAVEVVKNTKNDGYVERIISIVDVHNKVKKVTFILQFMHIMSFDTLLSHSLVSLIR